MTNMYEIQKGDIVRIVYWAQVEEVNHGIRKGDKVTLRDVNSGLRFDIMTKELIESVDSTQYSKTVELTPTDLTDKFAKLPTGTLIKACFDTKDAMYRVLVGEYLYPNNRGYSIVNDLQAVAPVNGYRQRHVDHRTLHWFIADGVRYQDKNWK